MFHVGDAAHKQPERQLRVTRNRDARRPVENARQWALGRRPKELATDEDQPMAHGAPMPDKEAAQAAGECAVRHIQSEGSVGKSAQGRIEVRDRRPQHSLGIARVPKAVKVGASAGEVSPQLSKMCAGAWLQVCPEVNETPARLIGTAQCGAQHALALVLQPREARRRVLYLRHGQVVSPLQ